MKILLTRHGQTNYNELGLCNADPKVDVYLTKAGVEQAEALRSRLAQFSIQKVYVSDLPRTHETASYCVPKHIPIIQDSRLSDLKTGFESMPVHEFLKYIEPDPLTIKAPGGESFHDLKSRVHSFIGSLDKTYDECVLIITHMDPAKIICGYFLELTDIEIWGLEIRNCELFEFHIA
jgi:broad specificity phosphatase PhoE